MTLAVVLTAAGGGTRLGHRLPKALVPLAGVPIVARAAQGLVAACPEPLAVLVVTAPAEHLAAVRDAVVDALGDAGLDVPLAVVPGGATRQASVAAALAALTPYPGVDVVLVHDAARPGTPAHVVRRVVGAVRSGHLAVVPAVPVADTIKRVDPGAGDVVPVLATLPRSTLRAVQTPQGFDRGLLERAHAAAAGAADDESVAASDDAGLVERLGEPVWLVAGDERSAKVTTARDLRVAELLLEEDA